MIFSALVPRPNFFYSVLRTVFSRIMTKLICCFFFATVMICASCLLCAFPPLTTKFRPLVLPIGVSVLLFKRFGLLEAFLLLGARSRPPLWPHVLFSVFDCHHTLDRLIGEVRVLEVLLPCSLFWPASSSARQQPHFRFCLFPTRVIVF